MERLNIINAHKLFYFSKIINGILLLRMEKKVVQNDTNTLAPETRPEHQEISRPASRAFRSPKQKHWLIVSFSMLILILLGTTGFFVYQNYLFKFDVPQEENETSHEQNLLQSINIDEVMRKIATDCITEESIKVELGYGVFELQFYQTILDDTQYQKLNNYLNFTSFPSSQELALNNTSWKAYSYSEASDIFTKDGYVCILLRPNRFGVTLSYGCTQAGKLRNNSLENVSNFIRSFFQEAGIECISSNCQIEEVTESVPLPMYTRSLLFFENVGKLDDSQQLRKVEEELLSATQPFKTNDWEVNTEDYTSTEKKWAKDTLTSQRLIARNNLFECVYTITIGNFGNNNKRKMIDCSYTLEALTEKQEEINKSLGLE